MVSSEDTEKRFAISQAHHTLWQRFSFTTKKASREERAALVAVPGGGHGARYFIPQTAHLELREPFVEEEAEP